MYSLLPGETVRAERRISVAVFTPLTVVLVIYAAVRTLPLLSPEEHRSPVIILAAFAPLAFLWIRLYRRTLFTVTDLRVVFTMDLFVIALSKSVPIEKILGVTRIDLPFIKAIFKSNIGFLFFTTGNPLTTICFPLLAAPEEVEETFNRLRFKTLPEESPRAAAAPSSRPVCAECGAESAGDTKFCKKCGAKIQGNSKSEKDDL